MLQNFQQQPVKPDTNTQPPAHNIQTQAQNVATGLGMVAPQPPLPTQPTQQKTAFDKVTARFCIFSISKVISKIIYGCTSLSSFVFHSSPVSLRNCWTVSTTMTNQKLGKKQRRMNSHHSPRCKPFIYHINHSSSAMPRSSDWFFFFSKKD